MPKAFTSYSSKSIYPELLAWIIVPPANIPAGPPGLPNELAQAREQILTAIARAAALAGSVALAAALLPIMRLGVFDLLAGYALALGLGWLLALRRTINYTLRGSMLVVLTYALALNEMLHFGYTVDAYIFLVAFALFTLMFFGWRVGMVALVLSTVTLAAIGWQLARADRVPAGIDVVSTCVVFMAVIGAVQAGMNALLQSLAQAWMREIQARLQLEHEHALLEQRVAERTQELARAHDATLAAYQTIAEQHGYLASLHQTTLDLLNQRAQPELLQTIVDRAAAILEAPYGELMLHEGDELVVQAWTANQPFLQGDRARRGEALLSWQAFDTQEPSVINDYSAWPERRPIYADVALQATADFPIVVGGRSLGVLALGRASEQPFSAVQVRQGQLFSQLIGLVLEHARLYTLALSELSERQIAEAALRAQNAELDAFAHTVAHDLKSPLTALIGNGELLQLSVEDGYTDDLAAQVETMVRVGHKMARIIDELLLLADVRKHGTVKRSVLDMDQILQEVDLRLAPLRHATKATITLPASWPAALGYAPWLEEVWTNYLSNAMKYGGPAPRITLGADGDAPGFVRFWVRDSGPGISAEQQERLFTAFTRLHVSAVEGHGLGLSIVQRIVAKLGGEVGVCSEPGQGSIFFFTLPKE
jgi:signal transduction histidine kinase